MFFKKKRLEEMKTGASDYVRKVYTPQKTTPVPKSENKRENSNRISYQRRQNNYEVSDGVRYSSLNKLESVADEHEISNVKFSERGKSEPRYSELDKTGIKFSERNKLDSERNIAFDEITLNDRYDPLSTLDILKEIKAGADTSVLSSRLSKSTNQSFVACVNTYIKKNHFTDSHVYKAAQLDRRLFSKMMSDYSYKPSKDTAIAICFALKLSLVEAKDLLSRAGYSLSHSIKRDIIFEYFFRSAFHNVTEINMILAELGEKPLGR